MNTHHRAGNAQGAGHTAERPDPSSRARNSGTRSHGGFAAGPGRADELMESEQDDKGRAVVGSGLLG